MLKFVENRPDFMRGLFSLPDRRDISANSLKARLDFLRSQSGVLDVNQPANYILLLTQDSPPGRLQIVCGKNWLDMQGFEQTLNTVKVQAAVLNPENRFLYAAWLAG